MALYNEKIGEMVPDKLIASAKLRHMTQSITVVSGQGVLKRGTVIASNGKIMASGLTPHGILCDDVDATSASVVAEVYVTGCFHKQALIVADGYTLSAADIKTLRDGGIFFENIME